ncbi:MAG: efflux RND transporter periplasmic adaptor subunit [bacterium]
MKKSISKLLIIIVAMLFMIGCGSEEYPQKDLELPVPVKTIQATVQPLEQQLTYSGTVEPIVRVRLSTKLMGLVESMQFNEGDRVPKGVTVVKLRSKDLEAKLTQAEARITEAEAHFKNVQINLQRIKSLYKKKAATQKELDDLHTAFISAKARKSTAEEMKTEVEELLKYTNLTSPFDGVITRKLIEVGDLANPGQPILEIENMNLVKIVVQVPESEVQNLKVGMPVGIRVQASNIGANGKSFAGTIHKIVPAADPMSRQFEMQVLTENPDHRIKSGMFARISVGNSGKSTLVVPEQAVFQRGQLDGLFVVDSESKARLRWVRTGREYNHLIEILSGLNPGEQVVVEGASSLLDGQSVEVTP